jgi:hypothetical protein
LTSLSFYLTNEEEEEEEHNDIDGTLLVVILMPWQSLPSPKPIREKQKLK